MDTRKTPTFIDPKTGEEFESTSLADIVPTGLLVVCVAGLALAIKGVRLLLDATNGGRTAELLAMLASVQAGAAAVVYVVRSRVRTSHTIARWQHRRRKAREQG